MLRPIRQPVHVYKETLSLLRDALETMEGGYVGLPPHSPRPVASNEIARVLTHVALRLRDDYPFFHPLYAGQMQQPPHPIARLAYALALWTNPNNHAPPGGRVSTTMEREVIAGIASMIGWTEFSGHLCGGGTIANAEAVWVASRRRPGTVVACEQAHYSHARMSAILGLPFESIRSDASARIDTNALAARLRRGDVGTVVATLGRRHRAPSMRCPSYWHCATAMAFACTSMPRTADTLRSSTTWPPKRVRRSTRFRTSTRSSSIRTSTDCSRTVAARCCFATPVMGPCSVIARRARIRSQPLKCRPASSARTGAAAVALWATMELLPLVKHGEFAAMLGVPGWRR